MNEHSEKPIEIIIKEAELRKLNAEADKAEAEKRKIDSERKELEKPFYKSSRFFQAIIAGVVGAAAIVGIFHSVIEPTLHRDTIYRELRIAEDSVRNKKLSEKLLGRESRVRDDSIKLETLGVKLQGRESRVNADSVKLQQLGNTLDQQQDLIIRKEFTIIENAKRLERLSHMLKTDSLEFINQDQIFLQEVNDFAFFLNEILDDNLYTVPDSIKFSLFIYVNSLLDSLRERKQIFR